VGISKITEGIQTLPFRFERHGSPIRHEFGQVGFAEGAVVGTNNGSDGCLEGDLVGFRVGASDGVRDGSLEGSLVGFRVGKSDGVRDGSLEGTMVRMRVGAREGR
jgi:hypothetical protein